VRHVVALIIAALLTASCAASHGHEAAITVLAASSLTSSFTDLGHQFERKTSTRVQFNFAASSTLARQIGDGDGGDVFASASPKDMDPLVAKHLVEAPEVFASNTLEIAVPADNPKHVRSLADLGAPGSVIVLCAASVPCGRLADAVLARAHVTVTKPSREDNVKAVLSKVSLGEADAGIVYVSDVRSAPKSVTGIPVPAAQNAVTQYPIAVLTHANERAAARAFVSFVLSPAGRDTLRRYGFAVP
jgi:molybdate transport system substrate-binding protein